MAKYKSAAVDLPVSAERVYEKMSNLENLRTLLDKIPAEKIPADKLEMFRSLEITSDSITVPAGPVGALTFRTVERRAPEYVKMQGEGTPVAISLGLHITPCGESASQAQVEVDVALPPMLAPMVGGQIQKLADQFGDVIKSIPF